MQIHAIRQGCVHCALLSGKPQEILDAQSLLDVLMEANYSLGTKDLVVPKELLSEDFFRLKTGLAGEILQKIVNYGGRIAIYGDFSRYKSPALRDFLYESNQGTQVFFAPTKTEAIALLSRRAHQG